jgi:membrane-associated phospholipid phosphatase
MRNFSTYGHMEGPIDNLQILRNVFISSVLFLGALLLALNPESFDRPLTRLLNSLVDRFPLFDGFAVAAYVYPTFSGAMLLALIWSCWFDNRSEEDRARILVGTLVSFGAGLISRLLQYKLPTHLRPVFDPALDFHPPSVSQVSYNEWNSFPSDHVTVFAGLVVIIYIARSEYTVFAIVLTILVELARTYMGGHYPSDLIGGAALAAMVVWAAQASWSLQVGRRIVMWERKSPSLFYLGAFFMSYQIATLALDVRGTAKLLYKIL